MAPRHISVIETIADGSDVVRIDNIIQRERALEVRYQVLDARHTDADVPPLFRACVLEDPLKEHFRGKVDTLEYTNERSEFRYVEPTDADATSIARPLARRRD